MIDEHVKIPKSTISRYKEEIKDMKQRVTDIEVEINSMKLNQKITTQNITNMVDTLSELKSDMRELNVRVEGSVNEIHKDIKESNDKLHTHQIEQLKQYKTSMWTVGGSIIGSITVGVILFLINI